MDDKTDLQKLFLELLFLEEYIDNPRAAATAAGYSTKTPITQIMLGLKEEIIKKTDEYIVLHAPKSARAVVDVLSNPSQQGAKTKLEASGMILDRAGITKKERVEVEVKTTNAVLILPTKKDN